jgi:L-ascorbate metabolism protein UlaG (beta-lactamase superfamily)
MPPKMKITPGVWPRLIVAIVFMLLASCSVLLGPRNIDYNASKAHHTPEGFKNRYVDRAEGPGFLKWQWERFRAGLPKPPAQPILGVPPDLKYIQSKHREATVTWVGHATVLLQVDGLNILTDPHWGPRSSPVSFVGPKRHQAPGIPFESLPHIDAVVISHNHYDHLDLETVSKLMAQASGPPKFFVPLGVHHWFKKNVPGSVLDGKAQNVWGMDWGDEFKLAGQSQEAVFKFLAIQHWSARGVWDRSATLWGSWAILHPKFRFWFSGDLGYSKDTVDIGELLGPIDLAVVPIGAYEPRWFMKGAHLNPPEAVQVMKDVKAARALAMHWGTFEDLTDEALDQPPKDLKVALQAGGVAEENFRVIKHGETWRLDARHSSTIAQGSMAK